MGRAALGALERIPGVGRGNFYANPAGTRDKDAVVDFVKDVGGLPRLLPHVDD